MILFENAPRVLKGLSVVSNDKRDWVHKAQPSIVPRLVAGCSLFEVRHQSCVLTSREEQDQKGRRRPY